MTLCFHCHPSIIKQVNRENVSPLPTFCDARGQTFDAKNARLSAILSDAMACTDGPKRKQSDRAGGQGSPKRRKALLEEESSDEEVGGVPLPDEYSLNINESFAKRFEYNKKREELHKCE